MPISAAAWQKQKTPEAFILRRDIRPTRRTIFLRTLNGSDPAGAVLGSFRSTRARVACRETDRPPRWHCCFLLAPIALADSTSGAVIREAGAIYLEDLLMRPARLATVADAPIYYHSDIRYLATLKKGQIVELQAVCDNRITGSARFAGAGRLVVGFKPKYTPNLLKKDFLENLRQNAARLEQVKALIAKNEVAINMTPEEVQQSLGKPTKKTSKVDASGRADIWEFIRYELVAQNTVGRDQLGNLVQAADQASKCRPGNSPSLSRIIWSPRSNRPKAIWRAAARRSRPSPHRNQLPIASLLRRVQRWDFPFAALLQILRPWAPALLMRSTGVAGF